MIGCKGWIVDQFFGTFLASSLSFLGSSLMPILFYSILEFMKHFRLVFNVRLLPIHDSLHDLGSLGLRRCSLSFRVLGSGFFLFRIDASRGSGFLFS